MGQFALPTLKWNTMSCNVTVEHRDRDGCAVENFDGLDENTFPTFDTMIEGVFSV
jgi:hypothetical protein